MKRVFFFLFLIVSVFVINNLVHSIYSLLQKHTYIEQSQRDLAKQKKEYQNIKKQLSTVSTTQFVEEEARSKLLLGKTGEKELVLPTILPQKNTLEAQKETSDPVWKQWAKLFF
jgi:cell division protein FtsB